MSVSEHQFGQLQIPSEALVDVPAAQPKRPFHVEQKVSCCPGHMHGIAVPFVETDDASHRAMDI